MTRSCAVVLLMVLSPLPCRAQSPAPAPAEPPLRRWLDLQTITIHLRYRFVETNADVVTSNDLQYKEVFRARLNVDARKRYGVTVGAASGSAFISTWDNTGLGKNAGDYHNHHLKQLFGSAAPVEGLELQVGGLYCVRGESSEHTTFDEDGYLVGERVTVHRANQLFFDELTVTHGQIGATTEPSLFDRWDDFAHQHYTQFLVGKRLTSVVAASIDYSSQTGADTVRGAISWRFNPAAPLSTLRLEGYRRVDHGPAGGFAVVAERPLSKRVRIQGGYGTIDEHYGNLNSDRLQRGRHLFVTANIAIHGPLTASLYFGQALHAAYALSNRTRFDAIIQYDVLAALRKTGKV